MDPATLLLIIIAGLFALIPIGIILGMFGLTLNALWSVLLFLLKYFLPGALIGLVVAFIRGRDKGYEREEYLQHIGIGAAVNAILLIIFLLLPANPEFVKPEEVVSVSSSFVTSTDSIEENTTEDTKYIEAICNALEGPDYSHVVKEFAAIDEEDIEYTVKFTTKDGDTVTYILCSQRVVGIKKGLFTIYYQTDKETYSVPVQTAKDVINEESIKKQEEEKKAKMELLTPFVEELFDSITYVGDESIEFVIPEKLPETNYSIRIEMKGTDAEYGEKYTLQNYEVHKEQQNNNSWVPGGRYRIDIKGIRFRNFSISVTPAYSSDYSFNVIKLLPREKVIK